MEKPKREGGHMKKEKERSFQIRRDKLGNKIKIYKGQRYAQGSDGVGISVGHGERTVSSKNGRVYPIPIGGRAHQNTDGSITPLKYGETPSRAKKRESEESEEAPRFGAAAKIEDLKKLEDLYESQMRSQI